MADLEITLDDVADLERKLAKIDLLDILREPMTRAILRLQSRMATYPPPPAGSKYRRSGNYGRLWTHKVDINGDSIIGTVGNRIMYGPYVGSERFQARVHRNRWTTDQRALDLERSAIISDFRQVINRALEDL